MAIISLKAWYIPEYEPLRSLSDRAHDLRLAKNSLLKSALRADFLDEVEVVSNSEWFQRYLGGNTVEFYIEGSGSYVISNIDLISHEIYFTKHDTFVNLEPTVFFSYQTQRPDTSDIIREALVNSLETLNKKARFSLSLEQSHRVSDEPIKMKSALMGKLRRSLLFVGDVSSIVTIDSDPPQLLLSPHVCVEVGYAMQVKRLDQILLIQIDDGSEGTFPFDLPVFQRLVVKDYKSLVKQLPDVIATHLKRFNLFP